MINETSNVMNDNNIGRLYNIINKLIEVKGNTAEDSFCKVFSLEEDDKASILSNYTELFKLCSLGIKEIEQLNPKNANKYKKTLNNVLEGLTKIYFDANRNRLDNGMNKFKEHFDSQLMISLEYCADYLSENSSEEIIEDEKIYELIKEINDMVEDIMNSKLNNELKKLLICQLDNIRESLMKYKFYGANGIETSISETVGSLIINREKVTDDKGNDYVNKIFKIIGNINSIISFKKNSMNLLESIYKKIGVE